MTWSKIKAQKEVDRSDPKAVFSEMKSKSFWSWHDTGMKGPENVHQRLRMQKRMVKDKAPLDVREICTIWPLPLRLTTSSFLRWLGSIQCLLWWKCARSEAGTPLPTPLNPAKALASCSR